jgi:ribonuclease HIII
VAQDTLVVKLTKAEQGDLRGRLDAGSFEWRTAPHAQYSVKGEGVVATLYNSGKLVVQGPAPDEFLARFVAGKAPVPKKKASKAESEDGDAVSQVLVTTVGSDEAGKGDFFGPLVVAAVRLDPEVADKMKSGGVMDSKKLTDVKALQLGKALRDSVPYSVVRVDPEQYNERYPKYSGLNQFLAELHAQAIAEVAQPGVRVLVDRFANESVMRKALQGLDIQLEQAVRAERNMAVAAASILARQEFLIGMADLSDRFSMELHKGAGFPVDRCGVNFVERHGWDSLGLVAKLHFKNTGKVRDRLS